ncbi:MAG TPA: hypothetical protein VK781_10820 [Solirubrobacteraceae bacterium]|nr:hypothetical protein [Solirubrobacteraceae bacterium]
MRLWHAPATLITVVLILAVLGSASAQAATSASIAPSLHPNRLGARSALTVTIGYRGEELSEPSPVTKAVVRLPAGMSLDVPSLRSCTAARLLAHGASSCPPRSQLGRGHALVETYAGSQPVTENVALQVFLGPPDNLTPTFDILAQGSSPVQELLVFGGSARPDVAPYGERLVISIPPVPSLPMEPDVSLMSLTLTIGHSTKSSHNLAGIRAPRSCPTGGFPFAAEFTYLEGARGSASAKIPCPR